MKQEIKKILKDFDHHWFIMEDAKSSDVDLIYEILKSRNKHRTTSDIIRELIMSNDFWEEYHKEVVRINRENKLGRILYEN